MVFYLRGRRDILAMSALSYQGTFRLSCDEGLLITQNALLVSAFFTIPQPKLVRGACLLGGIIFALILGALFCMVNMVLL